MLPPRRTTVHHPLRRSLSAAALLTLWVAAASAQSEVAAPAFSGRIEAGAAYVSTTDQLFAQGERRAGGLDDSADRSGAVLPMVLFDLRYRSEATGTEMFLGTPIEGNNRVGLTLGLGHPLEGVGTVELAAIASPWSEVWKDPYLTGVARDRTWSHEFGGRLGLQGIGGSGAGLSYTAINTRVTDDAAGERFASLRRSGWTHEVEAGYQIPLRPGVFLVPSLSAAIGDLDGAAEAYRSYEGGLAAQVVREQAIVNLFVSAGRTRYGAEHPDFGERRHDSTFGGGAMATLPGLFGVPNLFADVVVGYEVRDSDLGFFDAHTAVGAVALGYSL